MSNKKNVVLLTIDSLRADRCGFMGYEKGTTSRLDELAAKGLQFNNAIAPAGSTRGSMTAITTGTYPFERPGEESIGDRLRSHMHARDTIAERFSRMGYETGAFTANPWTSRQFGYNTGFDFFEDFLDDTSATKYHTDNDVGGLCGGVERMIDWWKGQEMFMSWESYYDDIREWLETATEPFFLWIFTVDVHMPYIPPASFRQSSLPTVYAANSWLFGGGPNPRLEALFRGPLLTAYDDTIRYTDSMVDRLHSDLDEDTLLCVHADHGELFGEHGEWGHGKLYEPVCHVPLIVANARSETIEDPVSLRKIPDLLTGLARGERPAISGAYATARNNHEMRIVRGLDWRYERDTKEESVATRTDGNWTRHTEHPLYGIGRSISDTAARIDKERTSIVAGAKDTDKL